MDGFVADDIILNKAEIIEKCLERIRSEYAGNSHNLRDNITKQDAIILNLERACQAAIDMGMRVVRKRKLGIPKESRDVFSLLEEANLISREVKQKMFAMVGFRNIAVHNYQGLNLDIVETIIKNHLGDFLGFSKVCLKL